MGSESPGNEIVTTPEHILTTYITRNIKLCSDHVHLGAHVSGKQMNVIGVASNTLTSSPQAHTTLCSSGVTATLPPV